ncbi:hypothetical protein A3Q56_05408 [Intoshia linei]|uniref:Inositol polyphosphate-related phosphatase domain-containing protein n=1 Tax=Intoshia linei TaxID=1819745 RepID=A0A177AXX1_9BILA|nr:hypothetical protein A3Q56_05408 [Intoshia linei]
MKKGKLTKTLSADYNNRHGRSVSDTDHKHVHFKKNPIKSTGLKGYSSFRDNRIPSRNMGSKNYMDSSSDSDSDIDLNEPIQTKSKLIPRMKMKIKPRQENVKFLNEDDEELLAQYVDKDYRGKTNKKHRKKTSSYDSDNSSEFSEDEYDVKKKNNNKHDFKKKKKISFMRQSSSSSSSNSSKSDYHKKHHRNKYSTDSDSDSSKKKKKLKKNKNIYKNKNINPSLQHSPKNNNFKTKFTNNSLSVIHTNDARNSSYLYGIINGDNSLLGINELERFFPDHVMRVFVGTWNMAQTTELPLTFNHFIMPMKVDHLSDIYVINVQEAVINM